MPYNNRPANAMGTFAKWVVVVVGVGAIGAVGYFLLGDQLGKPSKAHEFPNSIPVQQVATPDSLPVEKPVYDEPEPELVPQPLPDINQSDDSVLAALKALNVNGLVEMIIPQDILRKFVRAVDVVEEGKVVRDYRPIASPPSTFG